MTNTIEIKSGKAEPWAAIQTASQSLLNEVADHFDEEKHEYIHQGVALPSITQILKAEGFIDTTLYDEWSRERGTQVHKACHLEDVGELDFWEFDKAIDIYVVAWRRFKRESGFVPDHFEIPMVNKSLGYAGTPDRIGHGLSVARGAVELHDDGTYRFIPHADRQDVQIWRAALSCYWWKRNNLKGDK